MFPTNHFPFKKLHGAGNDFIIMHSPVKPLTNKLIEMLCHRNFGIGADGLILISKGEKADFKMDYFNADGFGDSMCGNGGRAAAVFAFLELNAKKNMRFEAIDGMHQAEIIQAHEGSFDVKISMNDISDFDLNEERLIVNTGSAHYVKRCDNLAGLDVIKAAAPIRYNKNISEDGVNVNFMERMNGEIFLRTYEKGVENETLACGTGATAAAIAAALWYGMPTAKIHSKGGDLEVSFKREGEKFTDIWLRGPVQVVFEGAVNLHQKQIFAAF
ncbi:MAG: diaminopimelate epimerase [Bacteroidales bacterium]|nr:diaminopimelate epimerase [Bacteroidales bacterium]